jgi:Methyltransferase domain
MTTLSAARQVAAQLTWLGEGEQVFRWQNVMRQRWPRVQGAAKVLWRYHQTYRKSLQFLGELLPEHKQRFASYWDEYFIETQKHLEFARMFGPFSFYDFVFGGILGFNPLFYVITRALQPAVAIETGVAAGFSSVAWLQALHRNAKGTLISFDLPPSVETDDFMLYRNHCWKYRPPGRSSGWSVPENLKDRWELILGDSCQKLAEEVPRIGLIDIFIHDSRHTYEHMRREFELVKNSVRQGGLILADDAIMNAAFRELAENLGTKAFVLNDDLMGLRVP